LLFLSAHSSDCNNGWTQCYWGNADSSSQITFHSTSFLAFQNVNHEFGHLLNYRMGDYFVQLLTNKKVYDMFGNFVMGGNESPESYTRIPDGYANKTLPDLHLSPQLALQHDGCTDMADDWCRAGNSPSEEWADLYANNVSDNFNIKAAGIARKQWVINAFEAIYNRYK